MKLLKANEKGLEKLALPKKIIVFLIASLVLIQIAAAQVEVSHISPTIQKVKPVQMPIPCKEEMDLWKDMEACKKQGMDYQVYIDQNRCKQVRCVKTEKAVTCPSDQELERKAQECKAKNLDYERYSDRNQCTQVKCTEKQTPCLTAHELEQRRLKCKAADKSYEYYADDNGCRQIKCLEKNCPTKEQLEERERKCKEMELEPYSYTDSRGCRMVDCKESPQAAVHCKKTIEGRCTIIRCEDGYTFNSCTFSPAREPMKIAEKMPEKEEMPVKRIQPARIQQAPQQAPPSEKIMIYKQPEQANKGGVLDSIGNFFKGMFK
ncbi:hypothetical protein KY338_03800 [Candidatus Woesearchaeota archaeon]|nr:hypothetical protein [Candidatus Woesearchaeota archaeon]MBW3005436.1 hypothetical protein [Candidatus Woesearchaeota archaeon]